MAKVVVVVDSAPDLVKLRRVVNVLLNCVRSVSTGSDATALELVPSASKKLALSPPVSLGPGELSFVLPQYKSLPFRPRRFELGVPILSKPI